MPTFPNVTFDIGTTTNRPMDIAVNGTGAWSTWQTRTFPATLAAGVNTIRATATTVNGGPNVDYLEIPQ